MKQNTLHLYAVIAAAMLSSVFHLGAQAPAIQWQNVIGGSNYEQFHCVGQTTDGGYILGGYSVSDLSGDKTENAPTPGMPHIWIVKTDNTGAVQWDNSIGSTSEDDVLSLFQTADGGYFVGGFSYGNINADKTENSLGLADYWVIKLNSAGSIVWQNTIGGTNYDFLHTAFETADGSFYVGGYSQSGIGGDKTEATYGSYDYWILKLDATGNILWQKTIGGSSSDYLYSMQQTPDGGLILCGHSNSGISGLKTEPTNGGYDYWVIKLDALGSIQWQNTIGGSLDETNRSIELTADGGYIIGGWSLSGATGDKTEPSQGNRDYWPVKLDAAGNIVWQNAIGGAANDYLRLAKQTADGGYMLAGYSSSGVGGDKTEPSEGLDDYWFLKLDNSGNILWQTTLGGTAGDYMWDAEQTPDGGYILGGNTGSGISGDVTELGPGLGDYWLVKLNPEGPVELCNGIDDDGDGFIDEGLPVFDYYLDIDGDGYGTATEPPITVCNLTPPAGYSVNNLDCEPYEATVNPSATEICNSIDDNCNGEVDEGFPVNLYYLDIDGDGYGSPSETPISTCALTPPAGYSANNLDCQPYEASVNPSATELCNSYDDNCNGEIDEGFPVNLYYLDIDADGYGTPSETPISTCALTPPAGYSANNLDCDAYVASTYPGAPELCNGVDDDCDGFVDEGTVAAISIAAGGPTTFCQGSSVVLTATHNGTSLQWRRNGVNIPGATGTTYIATTNGNYNCITSGTCGTAISAGINVTAYKNPNANITAGGPTSFCAGGSVVLTANAGAGLSYQWYKGVNPIAGATGISYTATTQGNYKCRVTRVATGCFKNSNAIAVMIVCREGEENTMSGIIQAFELYPNPATGHINVNTFNAQPKTLTLINHVGQVIMSMESAEEIIGIDVSAYAAGIYYVTIQQATDVQTIQFVKQ